MHVLLAQGWIAVEEDAPWDFHWAEVSWVREAMDTLPLPFSVRINHFRNHYELTRKDLIVKNMNRAVRAIERERGQEAANQFAFMPRTFQLPAEYLMFVEEFKRHGRGTWIMKPVGRAQGKGIFLFQKLADIADHAKDTRFSGVVEEEEEDKPDSYIVQRYIDNPYLVGGKKFDLRLYVLVTSFQPLSVWLYREGFARFSGTPFTMDSMNAMIHLTNVAIQKTREGYDSSKGCKWLFHQLKQYLLAKNGTAAVNDMLHAIDQVSDFAPPVSIRRPFCDWLFLSLNLTTKFMWAMPLDRSSSTACSRCNA